MSEFCDVDFSGDSDDAEPVEFYDAKIITARKAHVCTECGGQIVKGEQHQRKSYRFEGKFETDRICALCQEVAGEFDHRIIGGMLWPAFQSQWDDGAHLQPCLNRLETAKAKEHMRQQWIRWHDARARQRQEAIAARRAAASRPGDQTP